MIKNMNIRTATAADLPAIRTLLQTAFRHMPHSKHNEAHIVDALRQRGELSLALIGEDNGHIIAYLAASPVTLSPSIPNWYALGPIAVAPAWQKRGHGTALIHAALARLSRHAAGCVLLGDPAYYQRFGFAPHPRLTSSGFPREYFLALAWQAPPTAADVHYSPAFFITP